MTEIETVSRLVVAMAAGMATLKVAGRDRLKASSKVV